VDSDHIFSRRFWLGETDARAPALFRIALGALITGDLVDRLRDFHAFYTRDGLASASPSLLGWSLFPLIGGAPLFALAFLAAAALALGYRTRLAVALMWVCMVSLWNANPAVCDGGDAVVLALLFWSIFSDLGARYSLDVALGRRAPRATVPAAPIRFLQLQVAYIYLITFLAKQGGTWTGGTAVALALASPEWSRGLAPLFAVHPRLCAALTWATLAVEGLFPLLVFSPWWSRRLRAVALVAGLGLHAGIFLTMAVGIFSLAMPVSYLVLLREWLDALDRRPVLGAGARSRGWVLAVLAGQFTIIVAAQLFLTARGLVPPPLAAELKLTGHFQNWYMFAPDAPRSIVHISAPGVLADGRALDVVETIEPRLASRHGFLFSRWHKVRYALGRPQPELRVAVGRYLCRRHNGERPPPRLARFDLVLHETATTDRATVLLQQRCF
jgi:hypothetical protein